MAQPFNIYIGNHGKKEGIEDYLDMLSSVLISRGCQVVVSEDLRADIPNIIIDEFTNYVENRRIVEFKRKNPQAVYIYTLTEFCIRRYCVRSLNHFGGLADSAAISLLTVLLKTKRDDFGRVSVSDISTVFAYLPILASLFFRYVTSYYFLRLRRRGPDTFSSYLARKHHRLSYLHMRYLGLRATLIYADATITSHESIAGGVSGFLSARVKLCGVIYPEFEESSVVRELMNGRELFVEITGSVTPYRQKYVERINYYTRLLGIHNTFGLTQSLPFDALPAKIEIKRGAYSIHPPQTKNWPYASPTRIYRALRVDHNLPVLTKYFGQNPIEDVCLKFKGSKTIVEMAEMFSDRKRMFEFIEPRIKKYNRIAHERNDKLVNSLVKLGT